MSIYSAPVCFTVLIGLALIGVGAAVVRKANPMSGYLYIAAGALISLFNCCTFMIVPERLLEAGIDYDAIGLMLMLVSLARAGELILVAILLSVALVGLAKKVGAAKAAESKPAT